MEKKYRIMIGEEGDDFIFADDLTYEEALKKKKEIRLKLGAYCYIEEKSNRTKIQ